MLTIKEAESILKNQIKARNHNIKDYEFILIIESINDYKQIQLVSLKKSTGEIYSHYPMSRKLNIMNDGDFEEFKLIKNILLKRGYIEIYEKVTTLTHIYK